MSNIESVKGHLIVSCQALPDEPLHSSFIMGRMARAAKWGGAKGIRANTVEDINEIQKEVSMNIIANILGLGNAATPLGLKAMKSMQKENKKKDTLTDSMMMFLILNTASIQIIPTTVIAIRNSMGSSNSTAIVFPVWIATIVAAIFRNYCNKSIN